MLRQFLMVAVVSGALFLPPRVLAQAVFTPSQPTEAEVISARTDVVTNCGSYNVQTTVTGSTIRTTFILFNCVLGPPGAPIPFFSNFGPLPAGTYTYEVYVGFEADSPELFSTQPLVIAAVVDAVPTAGDWGLIALGAILAISGAFVIRHTPSAS